MGFDCELTFHSTIKYKLPFTNGLTEHEFDHIFTGIYEGEILANPAEIANFKYTDTTSLKLSINKKTISYTDWFKLIVEFNFEF